MTDMPVTSTGIILHLQRLSTEDGPGIRTTVFYKGCPLSCAWCHNPESLRIKPEVQWYKNRCIACNSCVVACGIDGLWVEQDGIERDRERCIACGECVEACPTGAMEKLGIAWTVEELVKELVKDRAYFEKSGGGVTLSGGEPSLQSQFSLDLIRALKAQGVSVALDTCGLCSPETMKKLLDEVDQIFFDIKLIDPGAHEKWVGVGNDRILDNLIMIGRELRHNPHKKLWIRTPLIPGATFEQQNIRGIGNFLAENLDGIVERWELCAFNNLCRDKYDRLGLTWAFADTPLMTQTELDQARAWAWQSGFSQDKIFVTGAAKPDN
jgi:pyruvate formate lyase activating enzyme